MHEIDLIPASYRRALTALRFIKWVGAALAVLVLTTAGARVWLDASIDRTGAEIARLQAQQTITSQERSQLDALRQEGRSYEEQLYLLRGLRSGAPTADLFGIIDQALIGDELWFLDWEFRRAGVTNSAGQSVETGYFIVVNDDSGQNDAWRVETHMAITGQAIDHAALSRFVQRLLNHPEIENAHVRRSELQRYAARTLVEFDLAVVINREAVL
jgi:hypothetical protein